MKPIVFFLFLSCSLCAMDTKEQTQEPAPNSQTKITYLQLKVLSSLNDLKEAEKLLARDKTEQNRKLVEACEADHTTHFHQLMVLEGQKKDRQHKAKSNKQPRKSAPKQTPRQRTDSMIVSFDKADSGTESPSSSDVSG